MPTETASGTAAEAQSPPQSNFGPSRSEVALALVPHLERAQALLGVAITAARYGDADLATLVDILTGFERHYMAGVDALQGACNTVRCDGNA